MHPRKPGLQPVDVMPVLPHMDRYGRSHVIASSMAEVVTHVLANGASEEQRASLYERCLLRTYNPGMTIIHLDTPLHASLSDTNFPLHVELTALALWRFTEYTELFRNSHPVAVVIYWTCMSWSAHSTATKHFK